MSCLTVQWRKYFAVLVGSRMYFYKSEKTTLKDQAVGHLEVSGTLTYANLHTVFMLTSLTCFYDCKLQVCSLVIISVVAIRMLCWWMHCATMATLFPGPDVVSEGETKKKVCCFSLTSQTGTYELRVGHEETRTQWIAAIKECGGDVQRGAGGYAPPLPSSSRPSGLSSSTSSRPLPSVPRASSSPPSSPHVSRSSTGGWLIAICWCYRGYRALGFLLFLGIMQQQRIVFWTTVYNRLIPSSCLWFLWGTFRWRQSWVYSATTGSVTTVLWQAVSHVGLCQTFYNQLIHRV